MKMRFLRRRIAIVLVLVYALFSLYAAYSVFFSKRVISRVHRVVKKGSAVVDTEKDGDEKWNPWEDDERAYSIALQTRRDAFRSHLDNIAKNRPKTHKVQIWGKAAIGLYLWEHILQGPLNPPDRSSQWREGAIRLGKIDFRFFTGPSVVQGHVPLDTDSVVLVLNGREQQKISYSVQWLQHVRSLVQSSTVSRVAVVLLGDEQCNNDWIAPYLKRHGGFVDLLFLVYDSPWVNDKDIVQWPLGVATYRSFPVVSLSSQIVNVARTHACNFLGTVYRNSSREALMRILQQTGLEKECLLHARETWLPHETADTSRQYQAALLQSDLTLCPVGVNTESYRIYEACAYGSVPVLEDVLTPGACSTGSSSPLRLLKEAGAPFIFLKDWRELPSILERERRLSQKDKVDRRMRLLKWYGGFRQRMRERFTELLEEAFF